MEGLAIAASLLLIAAVLILTALLYRQSDRTFSLRNALEESESRRREISNFLTRFSAGIKGEEGFVGAMNAAAIHVGEQTDSESVAIYIMDGSELRG